MASALARQRSEACLLSESCTCLLDLSLATCHMPLGDFSSLSFLSAPLKPSAFQSCLFLPPWRMHRIPLSPSLPHAGHSWTTVPSKASLVPWWACHTGHACWPAHTSRAAHRLGGQAPASTIGDSGLEAQPAQPAPALLTPQQAQELQDCKAAALARREALVALVASAPQTLPIPAQGSSPDAQRRDWSFVDPATSYGQPTTSAKPLPTAAPCQSCTFAVTRQHIARSTPQTPVPGPELPPLPRAPQGKLPTRIWKTSKTPTTASCPAQGSACQSQACRAHAAWAPRSLSSAHDDT